ncbi:MAG TPA: SURF1 family protein [Xanthobacteraceae bacterium]
MSTTVITAPRRRAGLLLPSLVAVAAFAALIGLGTWQVERKAWKEGLIDALEQRVSADPRPIPPPSEWSTLAPERDEFHRVKFAATIEPDADALVYTPGSAFRTDVSGPGYWVFTPAKLSDGTIVVLNRGFIPQDLQDPAARSPLAGPIALVGAMRWPEARGSFAPNDDPAHNLWFVRDQRAMAEAKGWGKVAPFFVELETPSSAGPVPQAGRLTVNLRNEHLQYAITWYGLAAVLAISFGFWATSRKRS